MEYLKTYKNVLKERNFEEQNRSLALRLEADDGDDQYFQVQAVLQSLEKKIVVDRNFHIQYKTVCSFHQTAINKTEL